MDDWNDAFDTRRDDWLDHSDANWERNRRVIQRLIARRSRERDGDVRQESDEARERAGQVAQAPRKRKVASREG